MGALHIAEQGSVVTRCDLRFVVRKQGREIEDVSSSNVDTIVLHGNVHLTTPAVTLALQEGVDVVFLSEHGRYRGRLQGLWGRDGELRSLQYEAARDDSIRLRLAKEFVAAKVDNSRAMWNRLRHGRLGEGQPTNAVEFLKQLSRKVPGARDLEQLRGYEGAAGAAHFSAFKSATPAAFGFKRRSYRPPPDPINALLSLGYALLYNELTAQCMTAGLDPYQGFYHERKHGHAALASDLMEEWRPIMVDALVLALVRRGHIQKDAFRTARGGAIRLTKRSLNAFVCTYDKRLEQRVHYPRTDQRLTFRQCIEEQTRLLAATLRQDQPNYTGFRWR